MQPGYNGYGMPTSGYSPNPGVAMMNSAMQQDFMQNMQWAMSHHQRSQGVLDAAAMAFTGGNGDWNSMWNDEATRAQASAMQTGVYALQSMGLMGGSSPFDLFAGMQGATAGSQFGVTGLDGRLMGSGAITSDVTRELYQAYQSDFYSPTGAANTGMTSGFNDMQMGQLFQELGQRGAFSGMQIGSYSPIGQEELTNRMEAARMTGNTSEMEKLREFTSNTEIFKLDESAKSRISEYVSSAAETLGVIRDVFGDRPMQELMQQAELITGENFVSAGPEYVRGRLEQTRGMARAYGIDEGSMMNFNANTTSAIDGIMSSKAGMAPGSFRPFAAAVSPIADENALVAYHQQMRDAAAARERGEYMPVRSMQEIAALSGAGLANIALEEREVAEAGQALELFDADPETRAEVMAAMSEVGAARTPSERAAARERLSTLTSQKFGITPGELQGSLLGQNGMLNTQSPQMREFIGKNVLSPSDQNRMSGNFDRLVSGTNMVERSGVFADKRAASDYMQTYMQSFNTETRRDLITALKSGDQAEVSRIISENQEFLPDGTSAADFIQQTNAGGGALAKEMEMIERLKPRYAPLSNMISRQEMAASSRQQLVQSMRDGFFGGGSGPGSLAEGVWQGVLGGPGVSNGQLLDFLEKGPGGVQRMVVNEDGSLNVDAAQAEAFMELAGDKGNYLMQSFGLKPGDHAGLAKALSSVEGHSKLNQFLKSSGMLSAYDREGDGLGLRVAGSDSAAAANEAVSAMADARMYHLLSGKKLSADKMEEVAEAALAGDLKAMKKQDRWARNIYDNIAGGDSIQDFMDPESEKGRALRAYSAQNPMVMESLRAKEKELRDAGDEESKKRADEIEKLRKQLGGEDGASTQKIEVSGTVKIQDDGNGQLALKSKGSETLGA